MLANNFVDSLNRRIFAENRNLLSRFFHNKTQARAEINLTLTDHSVELGGEVTGVITLAAGKTGVQIEDMFLTISMHQGKGDGNGFPIEGTPVCQTKIAEEMFLPPGTELTLDFKQRLPYSLPLSGEKTKYYVVGGCELKTRGPRTRTELTILPNRPLRLLQEAFNSLGFMETSSTGEFVDKCQLIRYEPMDFMAERFSEVKLFVGSRERELNIIMETKKQSNGERKQVKFIIPCAGMQNVGQVTENLKRIMQEI